jgi:cytidine deaminase
MQNPWQPSIEERELIDAALSVRARAYAPYSNFHVGAAVLTEDGEIFSGVNVENASYGLTLCAERVAVTTAVASGCRELKAVVVATSGGHSPCGACRQVLAEFGGQMLVLLVDADNHESVRKFTLDELLPGQFRLEP